MICKNKTYFIQLTTFCSVRYFSCILTELIKVEIYEHPEDPVPTDESSWDDVFKYRPIGFPAVETTNLGD